MDLDTTKNYGVNGAEFGLIDAKSQTKTVTKLRLKFTKPNAKVNGRQCEALTSLLNAMLGW